jgi:hypothetical protein
LGLWAGNKAMDAGAAKPAGGGAPTTQSLDASQHPSKRCKGADGTAMKAEAVADHYSNRANQSYQERMRSPILHLRLLNNWVRPPHRTSSSFLGVGTHRSLRGVATGALHHLGRLADSSTLPVFHHPCSHAE